MDNTHEQANDTANDRADQGNQERNAGAAQEPWPVLANQENDPLEKSRVCGHDHSAPLGPLRQGLGIDRSLHDLRALFFRDLRQGRVQAIQQRRVPLFHGNAAIGCPQGL